MSIRREGFALPTVLIASIVMLMVMLVAVQAASSVSVGLKSQYYNKIASEAAESGIAKAQACIAQGQSVWSSLTPSSNCTGTTGIYPTGESPATAGGVVINGDNLRTSFSVSPLSQSGSNSYTIQVQGETELLRASNGNVWRTYTQTVNKVVSAGSVLLQWKQVVSAPKDDHTCAITSDNQAYCWGNNNYGQLGNGSTIKSSSPVAVTATGALAGKTIRSISIGQDHSCAIASDNQAYCWGYNNNGQLGDGTTTNSSVPVAANTGALAGKTIRSISAGNLYTCVIASDNQAYCWGYNGYGQLGIGSTTTAFSPTAVTTSGTLSGKTIRSIVAGTYHTCAIASDNQAYCWGMGTSGQLGNGSVAQQTSPVAVTTTGALSGKTVRSISVGYQHTCAIASDNQAYCWGYNYYGQLGIGSTATAFSPTAVTTSGTLSGKTIRSIVAGYQHTCAIASDNQAYCWGYNYYGQLGDNSANNSTLPVSVVMTDALAGKTIRQLSAGTNYTCALASDNQIYCWGYNNNGQLGNGSTTTLYTPTAITPVTSSILTKITQSITSGYGHTCVIASDNQAYCWGYNAYGQLGNGTYNNSATPVPVNTSGVLAGKTIRSIAAGLYHTCVVASDNQIYCWGYNAHGELGNSSTSQSTVPVAVNTSGVLAGKTIRSIAAGLYFTCVIASDNQAYCWGYDIYGQLGNNSTSQSAVPVAVNTSGVLAGKSIRSITAGSSHACAIASDNQAYCWGYDIYGQLGNNSTSQSTVPVAVNTSGVLAGKSIRSITAGYYHTCAIASDNQAYCWGYDGNGQLGDNSYTSTTSVPVAVLTSGVLTNKTIQQITTGDYYTCVIASDNQAYCWGQGNYGQLGNNSTASAVYSPVAVNTSGVLADKTLQMIAPGYYHTCAIASDDQTYCSGYNAYGQLGNNSTTNTSVYTASSPIPPYVPTSSQYSF